MPALTAINATIANFPNHAWEIAEEATVLIGRYPDLDPAEADRLIEILPTLPMVHVALISSDDALAPRLQAFRERHARRLRRPLSQWAGLMMPVAMLVLVLIWLALK